ncbi:hypothetical protein DVH05_015708 [Phytophthora capsici]|nr:hypothetical protein DVH05_015708 [Phytophthora capsici]
MYYNTTTDTTVDKIMRAAGGTLVAAKAAPIVAAAKMAVVSADFSHWGKAHLEQPDYVFARFNGKNGAAVATQRRSIRQRCLPNDEMEQGDGSVTVQEENEIHRLNDELRGVEQQLKKVAVKADFKKKKELADVPYEI